MSLCGTSSGAIARHLLKIMTNLKFAEAGGRQTTVVALNRIPQSVYDKQSKSYFSTLPKLPLPPLKQTLQRFLSVSKALLPSREYENTVKLVEEFGKLDGEGEKLHALLEKRAEKLDNWLSDWWLHYAYLAQRCPLPINVSPGLTFPNQSYTGVEGQIDGQMELDTANKMPLDMSQYDLLFGTTRIPGDSKDDLRYGVGETTPLHHIIIIFRNRVKELFFKVAVYDVDGRPLSAKQIRGNLKTIVDQYGGRTNVDTHVGLLTTEERNVWAKSYKKLKSNPNNARTFDTIERGLFVLCIDDPFNYGSCGDSAFGGQLLHGGGSTVNAGNRWFQFVVAPDGFCGLTYEHSPAEGPPVAALMDYAIDFIPKTDSVQDAGGKIAASELLTFQLDDSDKKSITIAAEKFDKISSDVEMKIVRFKHFGKHLAKTQRVSPDSVVQLALQLTFYKLHNECPATYETGTLRRFHLGRTDTIRLPTMDSLAFCRAADSSTLGNVEKAEFFRKAVQSHKEYTAAACSGNGIDRHLLGLKLTALENGWPVPKLFESKAYETAMHYKLSTSQVAAKHDSCMMFGPMYPDCYGVCYNPQNNQINISVSAFRSFPATSAEKFGKVLEESLLQIRDILTKGTKSKL